ncbi:GntR family transcriptional regulator [Roseomonas sp. ACRSG]|nr:GntR family transcriptional regulator [Roseomonas sp. ACRSG]
MAEPLADIAYRRIKAAILDGSLPPGLQATEQQIAAQLGMSLTPVHTAIVRLQHDGWIALSARRGLVIEDNSCGLRGMAMIRKGQVHGISGCDTAAQAAFVTNLFATA